ncbi:hypothetical protein Moror_10574 [Moniliophthora roreri MCA 2997]|uniref:F-box domain-containing protein n=1 Tax=Moniliophthora roreri (strain MCA 2997) TaxID=1381753 RepID=V2XGY4_MONRO|nr:hypothetical protein Moror_10574 [Moniliophthora roreri MCA 2997]
MDRLFRNPIGSSGRNMISQFLADAEKESKQFQIEINKLKASMIVLENKQEKLKHVMGRYRSLLLLSPIHSMPTELLARIFTFCCSENHLYLYGKVEPLKLGMVCSRWRDIAFSTSILWSNITIDLSAWGKMPRLLESAIRQFMERSDKSLLRLNLDLSDVWEPEWAFPALRNLCQHSERWKGLHLAVNETSLDRRVFQSVEGRLASLKHLHIRGNALDDDNYYPELPNLFSLCPSLSSLSLHGYWRPITSSHNMPRAQITSLKLDCFIHGDALEYLVSFPNLQTLHLRCTGHDLEPYAASAGDKDICDLIALQSAVIEVEDDKQASFLFRYCTVPQLTSVHLIGLASYLEWGVDQRTIPNFISRSGCTITELVLVRLPILDSEDIGLLKLLPTLTTLRIEELERKPNNRIITTSFLDTLHVNQHSNSTTFLPRLTSLFLRIHAVSLDSSALVKAMTSRWAPDPVFATDMGIDRIRSIGIELMWQMSPWKRSPPDTPRKVFEPLRCLGDAGAKVWIVDVVAKE